MSTQSIQPVAASSRIIARLRDDYRAASILLGELCRQVDAVGEGQTLAPHAVAALLQRVLETTGGSHRALLDQLIDLLLHKGLTPAERRLVFLGLGQQQTLVQATADFSRFIDSRATDAGGQDIAGAAAGFVAQQRKLQSLEERRLLPLAVMHFLDSDWNQLESIGATS